MKNLVMFLVVSGLCAAHVAAEQPSGAQCGKVNEDLKRLACYDRVFRKVTKAHAGKAKGKWDVSESVSKFDDSRRVILNLRSEDKQHDKFGSASYSYLVISCQENRTSLWMTFAGHFMSSIQGGGSVTYRIDDRRARTKAFTESNDNSALGLWSGRDAIPFIKDMFAADSLVVRATPFSESSVTATYDIAGLKNAIEPFREACNW